MKKSLIIFLILLIVSGNILPIGFDLIKVLGLLSDMSNSISTFSSKIDGYYEEFIEFYKEKWAKYYSKLSFDDIEVFDTWKVDDIYGGSKINSDDMGKRWKTIFKNPNKMEKEFPYLFNMSHYRDNTAYTSNSGLRSVIEKNIKDGFEYLKSIKSLITLLENTRQSQLIRGGKVNKLKKYIRNFSIPKGHDEVRMGRLIGIEVIIDHEMEKQFVEYISLINARTEIEIKSACMEKNMRNRNYIFRLHETRASKRIGNSK